MLEAAASAIETSAGLPLTAIAGVTASFSGGSVEVCAGFEVGGASDGLRAEGGT